MTVNETDELSLCVIFQAIEEEFDKLCNCKRY